MGVVSAINGYQAPPDQIAWQVIIFTAVICTSLAFIIQTWAQSILAPTKVAVILTAEVVFAASFAVLFHNDPFTLRTGIGGALVVGAMYVIVLLEP
jgi:drug/metabolite transporter (DMT)-like permease